MQWMTRRVVRRPTAAGWAALLLAAVLAGGSGVCALYPFLAVHRPLDADLLVVEGWIPDHALRPVLAAMESKPQAQVIATGGPVDTGEALMAFGTWAEVTRERLRLQGFDEARLVAVPAAPVLKDRTLASAVALRAYLETLPERPERLDVVTMALHTRRTRLLFRRVLGPSVRVGVIAAPYALFDRTDWWRCSAGVRTVISEAIAYAYAALFTRGAPAE